MECNLNTVQKNMLDLEKFFPHYMREKTEQVLFAFSIFFLSLTVFFNVMIDTQVGALWPIAEGLFLFCFALLLSTILIEIYFNSLRIRLEEQQEISFATLLVIGLHHPRKKDLAKAFLHSRLGREVVSRLGIAKETLHHFLKAKDPAEIKVPNKGHFHELAGHLYDNDPYFRDFLERVHITRDILMTSSEMTEKKHHRHLSSRPFLKMVFHPEPKPIFSIDHITRLEIEELEKFYRIIFTEQAIQLIISYFKNDLLLYVSEDTRVSFLTDIIGSSSSVIMPADVRSFIINKSANH